MREKLNGKKFDDIFLESIDEALLALGEKSQKAIYNYLQQEFSISKNDIPDRINDFITAVEQVFGEAAQFIEILIMKCLQKKIKCLYRWDGPKWLVPDLTLLKYVKLMRVWYEDTDPIGDMEVILDIGEQPQQRV